MRLAGSAVANCDNVFATGRVLGTGEFQDINIFATTRQRQSGAYTTIFWSTNTKT